MERRLEACGEVKRAVVVLISRSTQSPSNGYDALPAGSAPPLLSVRGKDGQSEQGMAQAECWQRLPLEREHDDVCTEPEFTIIMVSVTRTEQVAARRREVSKTHHGQCAQAP